MADNTEERWINREDEFYDGAYRVEVPESGVFLVRADSAHRAAETAVGEIGYSVVDEVVERCRIEPAYDAEAPGLRQLTIYPDTDDNLYTYDGEYRYHANYEGLDARASVVGHSASSEHDAVENLLSALGEMGVVGVARVSPPYEPETVSLAEWRASSAKDDDSENGEEEGGHVTAGKGEDVDPANGGGAETGRHGGRGRRPGSAAGRIVVRDDFDDPLPEEMLAAFEGREAGTETDEDEGEG